MKFLLLLVLVLLSASCVNITKRRSTASIARISPGLNGNLKDLDVFDKASFNTVDKNANVVLYYLDEDPAVPKTLSNRSSDLSLRINVLTCEQYSIVENGRSCSPTEGTKAFRMPYLLFKTSFEFYLSGILNYGNEVMTQDKIDLIKAFQEKYPDANSETADIKLMNDQEKRNKLVDDFVQRIDRELKSVDLGVILYELEDGDQTALFDILHAFSRNADKLQFKSDVVEVTRRSGYVEYGFIRKKISGVDGFFKTIRTSDEDLVFVSTEPYADLFDALHAEVTHESDNSGGDTEIKNRISGRIIKLTPQYRSHYVYDHIDRMKRFLESIYPDKKFREASSPEWQGILDAGYTLESKTDRFFIVEDR